MLVDMSQVVPIEQLEKLHTKQLLNLRYKSPFRMYSWIDNSEREIDTINVDNIIAILATREHVPNKQESKALRKFRKKFGISRKHNKK